MSIPITKRQKEVWDFIKKFITEKEYAPTLEEIKKSLKLSAVSTVYQHIKALNDKGYIKKKKKTELDIEILNKKK